MNSQAYLYIAGHTGLVGSAINRKLEIMEYKKIICKTGLELDLRNKAIVEDFLHQKNQIMYFLQL